MKLVSRYYINKSIDICYIFKYDWKKHSQNNHFKILRNTMDYNIIFNVVKLINKLV